MKPQWEPTAFDKAQQYANVEKHTPGPWHTGGTFMPGTPDATQNIWSKAPPGCQSGDQVAQHVRPADARLIARAPDMYAALEECLEYFEERYDVNDGDYGVPEANKEMQMGTMIEEALGRRP